jgi:thiol-disulfide isomerase/thioredoxin
MSACSNSQPQENRIQSGVATVTGKVTGAVPAVLRTLTLRYSNQLIEYQGEYETTLNKDGTFVFTVPVASASIGYISSSVYEGGICLVPNEETKLEITFEESGEKRVNMVSSLAFTTDDMTSLGDVAMSVFDLAFDLDSVFEPDKQPEPYIQYQINKTKRIAEFVNANPKLSENAKQYISNELKLLYLKSNLLDYEITEILSTSNQPLEKLYSFLNYFDLNNPQYLYCGYYYFILQSILDNQILNIPRIRDVPVKDWLKEVKTILTDLIGADTGLFYEMLAASAYSKQFIDETKPLSDKQIENIKSYFKNKSYVDILLAENEKITKVAAITASLQINETPVVPKEKLMDAIVSKYKGKVVLVDFWATWCAPCLDGMKKSRELKKELIDKDVVFVYIANISSPKKLWETKIQGIGGEQYYLNREEWEYILDTFDFSGIPTYFLYDKTGELKRKQISFPGVEELRVWIEELL